MDAADRILAELKKTWKKVISDQFKSDPDKVRNANIETSTNEIWQNPVVKPMLKLYKIKYADVRRVLEEIKAEVLAEG